MYAIAFTGLSRLESIINLIGVSILFIIILIASYYTSKWVGKSGYRQLNGKNVQIIETVPLSQSKYIQIVKIGKRYVALGVTKEHIEFLCELSEDDLDFSENSTKPKNSGTDFKTILSKIGKDKKYKE